MQAINKDAEDRAEDTHDIMKERDASETTVHKSTTTSARKPQPPSVSASSATTRTEQRRRAELKQQRAGNLLAMEEHVDLTGLHLAGERSPHSAAASRIEDALEKSISDLCKTLGAGAKTKLSTPLVDRLQIRLAREEDACRAAEDWVRMEQSVLDGHLLSEAEVSSLREWAIQADGRPACAAPSEMDKLRRLIGLAIANALPASSLVVAPLTPAEKRQLADLEQMVLAGKLLSPEELATLKRQSALEAHTPPSTPARTTRTAEAGSAGWLPASSRRPPSSKAHVAKTSAQESVAPPKPSLSSYMSSGIGVHAPASSRASHRPAAASSAASAGAGASRPPNPVSASLPADSLASRTPAVRHAAPRAAAVQAKVAGAATRQAWAAGTATPREGSAEPATAGEQSSTRDEPVASASKASTPRAAPSVASARRAKTPRAETPSIERTTVGSPRPESARVSSASLPRAKPPTEQPTTGMALRPATARAGALLRVTPRSGERVAELEKRVGEGQVLSSDAAAELAWSKKTLDFTTSSRQWSPVSSTTGQKLSPRWAALEYETVPFPRRAEPPQDEPGPGSYSPRTGFDTSQCRSQLALSHVSLRGRHWQTTPASQSDTPGPASCAARPRAQPSCVAA